MLIEAQASAVEGAVVAMEVNGRDHEAVDVRVRVLHARLGVRGPRRCNAQEGKGVCIPKHEETFVVRDVTLQVVSGNRRP